MHLSPQYSLNNVKNWNSSENPYLLVCGTGGRISNINGEHKQAYHQDLSQNSAIFTNNTHKIPIRVSIKHPWKSDSTSYKYIGLWMPTRVSQLGMVVI